MREWITAFFMACGMFLAIPCPCRRWDERARQKMLVCLPLVGLVVGGVWAGLALLLRGAPVGLRALLLAVCPWLCTGFLHLDGYMDVCDAVLSRRDLATRQRILKDSHCGAFAVICMVLLALAQWSVFLQEKNPAWLPLLLIPAATRACAGLAVMHLRPMGTSQYAAMRRGSHGGAVDFSGARGRASHLAGGELCAAGRGGGVRPCRVVRLPPARRHVRRHFWLCADGRGAGRRGDITVCGVRRWIL